MNKTIVSQNFGKMLGKWKTVIIGLISQWKLLRNNIISVTKKLLLQWKFILLCKA